MAVETDESDSSAVRSTPARGSSPARVQLDLTYRDAVTVWVLCKWAGPRLLLPKPWYIARASAERLGELLERLLSSGVEQAGPEKPPNDKFRARARERREKRRLDGVF